MITKLLNKLCDELNKLDDDEKIKQINIINEKIADELPFKEPVKYVKWVKSEKIKANDYNPNKIATPEMELLRSSINIDGYTQPIITSQTSNDEYVIIDGFHRSQIGKNDKDIKKRLKGYLPITIINDKTLDQRMGSTIRHNRARGTHQIRHMSDIVVELSQNGWDDNKICKSLGMQKDEVLRLKQISGLKEAFNNHEFSKSWEIFISKLK
ncbi:ParB/RepB/Spo0J family partition protein [Methanosphaera cuniculi]|uniref:IbrB-like domain-containing protein n=1 Tax=Methanosphaera cuniculi TaxID=1077256 RepID=UPI0026F1E9E4|nr:ParB/RepB/Spo0J family partition protein [Methanosphaera cuniculi]